MSWRQLQWWMDYSKVEPFGEWRDDLRIAQVAMILANANRNPEAKPEPFTIGDFMFDFDKAVSEASRKRDEAASLEVERRRFAGLKAFFRGRRQGHEAAG